MNGPDIVPARADDEPRAAILSAMWLEDKLVAVPMPLIVSYASGPPKPIEKDKGSHKETDDTGDDPEWNDDDSEEDDSDEDDSDEDDSDEDGDMGEGPIDGDGDEDMIDKT